MNRFQRAARAFNGVFIPLAASPRWGFLLDRWMTVVTYTGRRSGQTFSLLVGYRRHGDRLDIAVEMPDKKNWWRNFTGDGGPIQVRLRGVNRTGHAVTTREGGKVRVVVELDPAG